METSNFCLPSFPPQVKDLGIICKIFFAGRPRSFLLTTKNPIFDIINSMKYRGDQSYRTVCLSFLLLIRCFEHLWASELIITHWGLKLWLNLVAWEPRPSCSLGDRCIITNLQCTTNIIMDSSNISFLLVRQNMYYGERPLYKLKWMYLILKDNYYVK